MPEAVDFAILKGTAFKEAEEYFSAVPDAVECIDGKTTSRKWKFPLAIRDKTVTLNLVLSETFPLSFPEIFVDPNEFFLKIPHVETSGKLCLFDKYSYFEPGQTPKLIAACTARAKELLEDGLDGKHDAFLEGFTSYWDRGVPDKTNILLVSEESGPSLLWSSRIFDQNTIYASSDRDALQSWQSRYSTSKYDGFRKGLFLQLSRGLFPHEYPREDLNELLNKLTPESKEIFLKFKDELPQKTFLVISFLTPEGLPVLGSLEIQGKDKGLTAPLKISRLACNRADYSWLMFRSSCGETNFTRGRTVAIIGCGSLGGNVADILSKSGIQNLILIDEDILSWDNNYRHYLGGVGVGKYKAKQLAWTLKQQNPHLNTIEYCQSWESTLTRNQELFKNVDVIVSVTGSNVSDNALSCLSRKTSDFPPIVFGWSEAYAAAGHALTVMPKGGCISCAEIKATKWDTTTTTRLPSCGGDFQPYGYLDLQPIHRIVAKSTLDLLSGRISTSRLHTYLGEASLLKTHHGQWTDFARKLPGFRETGSVELITNWQSATSCENCG